MMFDLEPLETWFSKYHARKLLYSKA